LLTRATALTPSFPFPNKVCPPFLPFFPYSLGRSKNPGRGWNKGTTGARRSRSFPPLLFLSFLLFLPFFTAGHMLTTRKKRVRIAELVKGRAAPLFFPPPSAQEHLPLSFFFSPPEVTSTSGTTVRKVMKELRRQDAGDLSPPLQRLSPRLPPFFFFFFSPPPSAVPFHAFDE